MRLGEHAWAPVWGMLSPILRELSGQRNIPTKTLRNWYTHFLLYGETRPETDLWEEQGYKNGIKIARKEETNYSKWNQNHTEALSGIVNAEPWLFLDEIRDKLLAATGTLWSPSHIHTKMKQLGLSLQVVTYLARQRDEEQRSQYKSALEMLVMHPNQLLFLDETAKGRNDARRRRSYSPRGVTPTASVPFTGSHGKRYSMLAACDMDGFIKETCEIVEREGIAGGTVDTGVFTHWLNDNVIPVLGRYNLHEPHSIVVLDNASIHHTDEIVELIENAGAMVLYLAPYSPDLNPIELMFGQYKMGLKRHQGLGWWEAHMSALATVKPHNARNYYRRCGVPRVPGGQAEEGDEEEEVIILAAAAVAMHCTVFACRYILNII